MLKNSLKNYDVGMYEQNVIAYLIMQKPELAEQIAFEREFCINCW